MLGIKLLLYLQLGHILNCYTIPRDMRAKTVQIQKSNGYLPFSETIGVELGQIQDFVCPEKHDFILYLVPEISRDLLMACEVSQLQLLHHCVSYRFSKFTLYYSPMTPSGGLEFERGTKYWVVSTDCSVQIKIYVM